MLWKPSEKMSSSPGFAGRMVHLALQGRKILLKIDKLLLVCYILPSHADANSDCFREGRLQRVLLMFVEFGAPGLP